MRKANHTGKPNIANVNDRLRRGRRKASGSASVKTEKNTHGSAVI